MSTLNGPSGLLIGERSDNDSPTRKLLDESPSTLNGQSGLLIGERSDEDSLTSMMVNSINVDNIIVGTNSSLTSEFQMSDPNLRWLKNIIISKKTNKDKFKTRQKGSKYKHQKEFFKQLPT